MLALRATREGWLVQDHQSRHPGTGAGRVLRGLVMPALVEAADRDGVVIYTTAANPRLAALYTAELPGLRDVGRGRPRGRRLRRTPVRSGLAAQPVAGPAG